MEPGDCYYSRIEKLRGGVDAAILRPRVEETEVALFMNAL